MQKQHYLTTAFIGTLMLVGAQTTQAAEVFVDPPLVDGFGIGDTFEVTLRGEEFTGSTEVPPGTAGGGMDIEWNPDVLNITDFDNDVKLLFPGNVEVNTFLFINEGQSDLIKGPLIGLTVANIDGGTDSPDFEIASILFTIVGFGETPIDIGPNDDNPWTDRQLDPLVTQPSFDGDGFVSVVPLPAAAWFLASGLFGLAAIGRRAPKKGT